MPGGGGWRALKATLYRASESTTVLSNLLESIYGFGVPLRSIGRCISTPSPNYGTGMPECHLTSTYHVTEGPTENAWQLPVAEASPFGCCATALCSIYIVSFFISLPTLIALLCLSHLSTEIVGEQCKRSPVVCHQYTTRHAQHLANIDTSCAADRKALLLLVNLKAVPFQAPGRMTATADECL
jgi:hypothetical protein